MNLVLLNQEVPVELLVGEPVGTMQLFASETQKPGRYLFGVANKGRCVKPPILKQVVILNPNFFVYEDGSGSKSIANKNGRDIAENPGYMHDVAQEHIVSYVLGINHEHTGEIIKRGVNFDGTIMPEEQLINQESSFPNCYEARVNFKDGFDIVSSDKIKISDSRIIFEQELSNNMIK